MITLKPTVTVRPEDKVSFFSFSLMDTALTSFQVLEFFEETAAKKDDIWAYRFLEDGRMVEVIRGTDKHYLYADAFELIYPETSPSKILMWWPPCILREVLNTGEDIPVQYGDEATTYTSLISK